RGEGDRPLQAGARGRGPMRRLSQAVMIAVLGAASVAVLGSCSTVSQMRGEIEGLSKVTEQAERNGAIRSAPRELAMATAHLKFAEIEIDRGFPPRAKDPPQIAASNAHAAYALPPPAKCAERGFEEPTPQPGDRDGDGYLDNEDKCPDEAETW